MKKLFLFALALLSFAWSNASAAPRADEVKHDGYAVFVLDQTGWDAITLYMWGDVNNLNGAWPGMQVTGTENVKGIEYKYFDMGATNTGKSESLIFNNNNGGTKLKDFAYTINRDIYLAVTASGVREITHADSIPDPVLGNIELWPSYTTLLTEQPAEVKVLSMNNSLIHYETEWQDDMFNRMVVAEGKNALWTAHTNLGKSLQYHYDEGEGLTDAGTPSARMLVRTQAWTHIILQEQTAKPRTNFSGFRSSVKAWVEYIRTNCPNPNAVIILPVNWAYATDAAFTASNAEMLANYRAVAQEFGVVLCPVVVAYEQAYEKDATILQNWFKDDRHPKQNATYMACCLEYATIFGVSCHGLVGTCYPYCRRGCRYAYLCCRYLQFVYPNRRSAQPFRTFRNSPIKRRRAVCRDIGFRLRHCAYRCGRTFCQGALRWQTIHRYSLGGCC